MNIAHTVEKIKTHQVELTTAAIVVLVSFLSFGLGRWTKIVDSQVPLKIENIPISQPSNTPIPTRQGIVEQKSAFVASVNGAKYYPVGCKASERIKKENQIFFSSAELAENAGYAKAANCQ